MAKPKTKPTASGMVWTNYHSLSLIVFVAVLVVGYLKLAKPPVDTPTQNTNRPGLTITTSDGIKLASELTYPGGADKVPAVILIHQFGQDRRQWDPYINDWLDAGFAVLTYDMRGFGDSRISETDRNASNLLAQLPNDVPAVIEYLKQQPRIVVGRISVVGASVGANVAFVASGSQVYRTVMLSPGSYPGVLDGSTIEGFVAAGILGVAAEAERAPLETLMAQVNQPKSQLVVDGSAHGVALLTNPEIMPAILDWIAGPDTPSDIELP